MFCGYTVIPGSLKERYEKGNGKYICGMFGINIDENMGKDDFEYLIADVYNPVMDIPDGFIAMIPAFTWAVFSCDGSVPTALQDVLSQRKYEKNY